MTLFGASGLLIGITSIAFGILVYARNTKNPLNRVWGLFGFSVAIWGFGVYAFSQAHNPETAILWWRITHIGVIFIPVFFLHFVYLFLELKRDWIVHGVYTLGIFFSCYKCYSFFHQRGGLSF